MSDRTRICTTETHDIYYRILFQRGVYPADDFHMVKKYGQTILVTQDLALENYLDKFVRSYLCVLIELTKHHRILSQMNSALYACSGA